MNSAMKSMFRGIIPMSLLVCALLVLVAPIPTAQAQDKSAGDCGIILNLSGKQRMLTQKMSKEVVLIALDCNKDKNLENLSQTAQLFDITLAGLKDGNPTLGLPGTADQEIRAQLDLVGNLWNEFHTEIDKIIAAKTVTSEQMAFVTEKNLPLLAEMNKCVKMYETRGGSGNLGTNPGLAVTINLAGKQRMLSQKMSKEYFLVAYGLDVETNKSQLKATCSLFDKTLIGLLDGDPELELTGTVNPKIRKQLSSVQLLWSQFRPAMEQAADPGVLEVPRDKVKMIANGNPVLLKRMNEAVQMYEREAAQIDDKLNHTAS